MNIFSSKNSLIKHSRLAARLDPVHDWIVLLICGAVVLVGIVVWNVWAFNTVANGGVIGKVATSTPSVFNQTSIDMVHTIFSNRVTEEGKYVMGVYRYADPSL